MVADNPNVQIPKRIIKSDKVPRQPGRLVIPHGAEPVGNPPQSWRVKYGQAMTIGDLRAFIEAYDNEIPLMVRNGPLPTVYYHCFNGIVYIEFD